MTENENVLIDITPNRTPKKKSELSKLELSEVKRLRKEAEKDYKMLKKVSVPQLQLAHLERIIRTYNKIYRIEIPSVSDKAVFMMIKIQYKGMCAVTRTRPQPDCK